MVPEGLKNGWIASMEKFLKATKASLGGDASVIAKEGQR